MATVQEPKANNRYESFVEAELGRARRRIQSQDVGMAALGLLAGTLAYALGMVVLDRWLNLSDTTRQISLFAFLAATVAYAVVVLSRPLRREVNPYFAARQVERAVPGAKNSVVSWLDLHDEDLPESIKAAVSQKAAADMKRADVDEVVRDGRLPWVGGVAGGLFVAALILFFLFRPNQFLSLLGRAFTPFGSGDIARQTTLNVLQPTGGDVTVPVNSQVNFRVEVLGRLPDPSAGDAVRLRFRYNSADPVAEEIRLDPSPRDPREFSLRMPAARVQNGFVYQIVGGDAATQEHRVQVTSSPLIEGFDVVYHFRPYLRFRDQTVANPNLVALRGTEVTLTARTNRNVKGGALTFQPIRDGQKLPPPLKAEAVAEQPASLRFRFTLEEDAKYTISFVSVGDERNEDPIPYTIKVLSDHAPQVEVTNPAPDTLPVNGTINVEGKASDDFGITAMRLCMNLVDAEQPTALAPKPYRPGKVFKFADDTYPRALDYKDFLPLDQLKTTLNGPVALKPGMVIEYWLEATDNCDCPEQNVGKSNKYRVKLADPQEAPDKQAGEKQAAGDKADHDKKQDQDLNQQNEAKKQAGDKSDQGEPNGDKPGDQAREGDPKNQGDDNQQPDAKEQAVEKQAEKIRDKVNRSREQGNKGEAKGAPEPPQPQPGEPPMNPGELKPEPGDNKTGNPPDGAPNQPGQPKDQNGEGKGDKQTGQPQPNGDKGENKPDNQPSPGEAKPMPQAGGQQPNDQGGNPNPGDQKKSDGTQPDANSGDQKQPNPADQKNPNGAKPDAKPGDQKQPNPADQKNPNGGRPDAKPGDQKQPNTADQKNPNGAKPDAKPGDQKQPNPDTQQPQSSGPPDSKTQQPNGNSGQPQAQPNPGDAKQQPQDGGANAGEKKDQPKGDQQPGESKESQSGNDAKGADQKPGNDGGKPKGEPNIGNQTSGSPKESKPSQPNGATPDKPANPPGNTKPSPGDRPTPDKPKDDGTKGDTPPKPEPGAGAQPGNKGNTGERPGQGPKQDPNNQEPKGAPNPNDPDRDGAGGKTGSGTPGDSAPKGDKPKEAPSGQGKGGAPDVGEAKPKPSEGMAKGEAKPSGDNADEKKPGQPGAASTGQGDLQDAPKGGQHDQPGGAAKNQPKTDGTPSSGQPSGNQSNEKPADADKKAIDDLKKLAQDLKSGDAQTRQAAENKVKELAKEMAKHGNAQKPADPQAVKAATERANELLKQLDKDPEGRQALENAAKNVAEQMAKDELQKLGEDLKSGDAKTREAAKERAKQLAQGDLKKLADDARSNDPQRQQKANDELKKDFDKDPQTREAVLNALKGDPNQPEQPEKKSTPSPDRTAAGQAPDVPPPPSTTFPETGPAPDPKNAGKTSDLQLERFPKNPSKELLQDLGMTEEQYRQFLKDAAELQKKRDAEAAKKSARGANTGNSAANSGVKRVESGTDKGKQLERGGATLPPEEYRDGYKGFTEDVSKTAGAPKKE